jgi:transposase
MSRLAIWRGREKPASVAVCRGAGWAGSTLAGGEFGTGARSAAACIERAGTPAVWRRSVSECPAVIDFIDARIEPLNQELKPFAHADPRAVLLDTIPGVAELLALTIAVEVGEISRFAGPEKLVSYGRLAPRVHQSGQARPRSGPLSKSGSRLLGWAAVEAAQQAWRESNPWHDPLHQRRSPLPQQKLRQGCGRAEDPDRRLAHALPQRTLQPCAAHHLCPGKLPLCFGRLDGPLWN